MLPVRRQIQEIVEYIDARCAASKGNEGQQGSEHDAWAGHLVRQQCRQEDQRILDPLMQSNGFDPRSQGRSWLCEYPQYLCLASDLICKLRAAHDNSSVCRLPHGQIGYIGANVVKSTLAVALDQYAALTFRRGTGALERQCLVEQAQIAADLCGQCNLAIRQQNEPPSGGALFL
jgi:hypothetical protein